MNTKTIAALLITSAAVFATAPAFAGNLHADDDVSSWEGPSTLTRAQVRHDLIKAEQQPGYTLANSNVYYPQVNQNTASTLTRAEVKQQQAAQEAKQTVSSVNENTMYPTAADKVTAYSAPAVSLSQGNGHTAPVMQ